ncbi:hypothetical protein [Streptomyces clavifer]|uniref:hypothetical protein n=1 Tax=Streptomyces clavifer TaxID=68188 RepID=UPI003679F1D1
MGQTGMFVTNESFVPIKDTTMVEDHLEVPFAKDTIKDAPNIDVDADGHPSEEEHHLDEQYGTGWDAAWSQANQPGTGGWARTGDTGTSADMRSVGMEESGDAMTRSEEQIHVGTEH